MDTYTSIFYIVGILVIVLLIGAFKNRTEWMINFILRGISGMLMIYFLNFLFEKQNAAVEMGYNLVTFLTSAILGFPGVVMLYGINFYMIL